MTTRKTMGFLAVALLLIGGAASAAELRFGRYFTDHMVLQRGKPLVIRGFADAGARVTVAYVPPEGSAQAGQEKRATAGDEGAWSIVLDPLSADGGGGTLTAAAGSQRVRLQNVVVGDVFLFARQTTIDVSLGRDEAGRAVAKALRADPRFRAVRIKTIPAAEAQSDLAAEAAFGWAVVDAEQALPMSAAAFRFGSRLAAAADVPIGIVDLDLGPYFPIAWMSREALLQTQAIYDTATVAHQIDKFDKLAHEYDAEKQHAERKKAYEQAVLAATEKGLPPPPPPPAPLAPLQDPRYPAAGYNGVLHPLRGLALKGLLLQLGNDYPYLRYQELARAGTSLDRAWLGQAYKDTYDLRKWCLYLEPVTTPRLAPEWRNALGDRKLPVALILPPGSNLPTLAMHHREMRELQRRAADRNPGVRVVLPGIGAVPFSAQPADETLLADRCLNWAQGAVYKQGGAAATGPLFDHVKAQYSKAQVFFEPGTADGLKATPGALDAFEVAGADGEFSPAAASIDGSTVRLSSATVNRILYVRYNWREKPDQGLVNAAGLPAIPFRTDEHEYPRTISTEETEFPEEYSTPANKWKDGDVAIINASLAVGNWPNGEGWLGVTGIMTAPFGPNMSVLYVLRGSPADGKILPGDVIYAVNDKPLGEDPLRVVSGELTAAESEAGGGRIAFGLRRAGETMTVPLQVEVLGSYSSTAPYDCPKTDRIVSNAEAYVAERGCVMKASGGPGGFLGTDALFLLAAGTPEYQGLVRRIVYAKMAARDITKRVDPLQPHHPQNWFLAYEALLAGEYYLATGDPNVRPYLKYLCDYLAMTQVKVEKEPTAWPAALKGQAGSWRHNWYGGQTYGLLQTISIPALLAFHYAEEAGLDVDDAAYQRGLQFLRHNGVEVGSVFYGWSSDPIKTPRPIDPAVLEAGKLSSNNGVISAAAILFRMVGDPQTAHLCSLISAYSYNNTAHSHGGNFWGNWLTPLGANVQGHEAFLTFMRRYRWYMELNRMYDHGYYQGSGGMGVSQLMALVVPRQRLRILGAPASVFAADVPELLRPARDAYERRDYARCEQLVDELLTAPSLLGKDLGKARQLQRAAREIQESIALDLAKVAALLDAGKVYEAGMDLPQLRGVAPAGDPKLAAIEKRLASATPKAVAADKARYEAHQKAIRLDVKPPKPDPAEEAKWTSLTTIAKVSRRSGGARGVVDPRDATRWHIKVLEAMEEAPEGWTQPEFEDGAWGETALPISWSLNHTALLRARFEVRDKSKVDDLRLRMWIFRQQNIEVYLNGKLVAKINKALNNFRLDAPLNQGAIRALRNGTNTIAITMKNNWRWGRYFAKEETETANSVYNSGVTVLLDGAPRNGR